MPAFTASAPGKIILFGEHAVVYGQPAIAVPVDQVRARAIVTPRIGAPSGAVHLLAPKINLDAELGELAPDHPLATVIRTLFHTLGVKRPPSFSLKITSDIPVASGLGSGAAVSVALIRAVAAFLGKPLPDETVNALAFEAEKIYHGTPSGIDNTVITYARPVYFVREEPIETFSVPTPFTVVIADSGIASPTAQVVSEVRHRWQADRDRYDHLFSEIGHIARQARQAIESGHPETLGELMDANQFWLQEAGVSSPTLEHLIESAHQAGALGAKLSGAGRGGNIIALVTPQSAPAVSRALLNAGARHTITTTVR